MMNYKLAQKLAPAHFKRRFRVHKSTFKRMLSALGQHWGPSDKPGRKPKLCLPERVLVALEYWREYRTYFHIGSGWGISESSVCRIVHKVEADLMGSGLFRLPGKKQLVCGFAIPEVVVMDVTEIPYAFGGAKTYERPKRRQCQFYSGKKKRHTLKCQLIIEHQTGEIICTFFAKGRRHDFKLFRASGVQFHPRTESLQDKGYQGIQKLHSNSRIPRKKPRGGHLSQADRVDLLHIRFPTAFT